MFTNMGRQRPDFPPIFNRLLPKIRLHPGLCPDPAGGLTAPPNPQLDKVGSQTDLVRIDALASTYIYP